MESGTETAQCVIWKIKSGTETAQCVTILFFPLVSVQCHVPLGFTFRSITGHLHTI